MIRALVVDEDATLEAEAQVRYYFEQAGPVLAQRFAAEVEAVFRGLLAGSLVGVNHPLVPFRVPLKRVLLDRFPFSVVFYLDNDVIHVVALEAHKRRPGYWKR